MDRTDWFIVGGAALLLFGSKLLFRFVPPHCWYLSPRKRRAMVLAVSEFAAEHPNARVNAERSWIYQTDSEKCFVFVQHLSDLSPPEFSGYVVWHDQQKLDRLGVWTFHWGFFQPQYAVEQYEACLKAGKPW